MTTLNPTFYGMGFFEDAEKALPPYALVEAVRQIAIYQEIREDTPKEVIETLIVARSLKELTYQDFLNLSPYLFYYDRRQTGESLEVNLIEPTRSAYELIKVEAERYFDLPNLKGE